MEELEKELASRINKIELKKIEDDLDILEKEMQDNSQEEEKQDTKPKGFDFDP